MNKQQIISFILTQLASGRISNSDLIDIARNNPISSQDNIVRQNNDTTDSSLKSGEFRENSRNLTKVFYVIGMVIAIIGIIILIGQNWDKIGFAGRILVTLGISFTTYIIALLIKSSEHRIISQIMFIISAILSPMGIFILLGEYKIDIDLNINIMISLGLAVIYGFAFFISKKNILAVFVTAFVTWAYYAFIAKIFNIEYANSEDIIKWATMLLGLAYIFIAYEYASLCGKTDGTDKKEKTIIKNLFYSLGTIAILGAGISIGGTFDIIFIAIIFMAFYASVYLRSAFMLVLAGMFLITHTLKLTGEYFVDSIGWPIALIGSGFIIIGVGYLTYYLNKKFISKR